MRWKATDLPHVRRQPGESFEELLRRFVYKTRAAGIVREVKERRAFIPRTEQRRRAVIEGKRRARRRA